MNNEYPVNKLNEIYDALVDMEEAVRLLKKKVDELATEIENGR